MSAAIRIPVRTHDVTPARPISANDRRILDWLSRRRLLVVIVWNIAGCTEVRLDAAPSAEGAPR